MRNYTLTRLVCLLVIPAIGVTAAACGGEEDASANDAGASDVGDSELFDTAGDDADTSVSDAAPTDTEPADADPGDTEPTDTEPDTAPTDTSPTDTGPADTGPMDTTADSDAGDTGQEWPIEDGVFGTPENTFMIPEPNAGTGIYLPDIQDRHSEVDWATLDRLCIPAGHYPFIRIGNLPQRNTDRPLVITNCGGQVRVGDLDHYYLFALDGGSNWILTGRYDATSETGHIDFPGHRAGAFANSQDTYGIVINDGFNQESVSGLAIGGGATNFEVEYVEITEVGFAGLTMKTDDDGEATMFNVSLHDLYIHDTGSEGVYIGSTQTAPQHRIVDMQFYNNRVVRTGTEAIQLGQLGGVTRVHNNVFGPAAMDWRSAFQQYQDNNFQIGIRDGHLIVENNIFLGGAGSMISLFAQDRGDNADANVGVTFENNYFGYFRNLGAYVNNVALPGMTYRFERNGFGGYRFERDEVYADATEYANTLRIANDTTPVELIDNEWSGTARFCSLSETGNGDSGNATGSGNSQVEPEPPSFVQFGYPDGFDYLTLEMWTDVATLGGNQPVDYTSGDAVMHRGDAFVCATETCPNGAPPNERPAEWTSVERPADDVRTRAGTRWEDAGPRYGVGDR